MSDEPQQDIPQHLGFILDGNRRWAKKHGLPTYEGHLAGYHALKEVILKAADVGVKYVSIYAFSTENWKRSRDEVDGLMSLAMRIFKTDINELVKNEIRVRILGARESIPPKLLKAMEEVEEKSKHFTRTTVAVCFNYGGQREIVDAVQQCIDEGITQVTENDIRNHLYEPEVPDIDMVVRSSGEERISNFMLWRIAYSEFYFIEKLWPDMRPSDVEDIIKEYNRRNRRFGGS
jgi:undecaprenyl diphosphate synthase